MKVAPFTRFLDAMAAAARGKFFVDAEEIRRVVAQRGKPFDKPTESAIVRPPRPRIERP